MSSNPEPWNRTELLNLLSASATLAGLCITIVAVMNTFNKTVNSISVVDDILAISAASFLLCTYLIFWALRTHSSALSITITKVIDVIFLLALSAMTVAGFIMIYTIW